MEVPSRRFWVRSGLAHCDGLDGPVVKAAQRALETRNPALVLIWVQEKDEREIRIAFEQTLAVREPLFRRPTKRFVLAGWSPFGSCSRTPCSTGSVKSSRR